jgi:hypothetical protein
MTSLLALTVAWLTAEPTQLPRVRREEAEALAARLSQRTPFLESEEARREPATLRQYFRDEDYRMLRGNPLLGYWDLGGFRWGGTQVAWSGMEVKPGCAAVSGDAWSAAFSYAARKRRLAVNRAAAVRISGACIWAVVEATRREPVPGVLLEIKVTGPTGTLRYRFGMGKPTVEDAVGAAMDFVVGFAQAAR